MVIMTRDFIKLVARAIAISIPLAWWLMNNWLQDFSYHITPDAWIFISAALLALATTLFTIGFQASKTQ